MTKAKADTNATLAATHSWGSTLLGAMLLAACSTGSPGTTGSGGGRSTGGAAGCVEKQLCERTAHWDPSACACVPDTAEGGAGGESGVAGGAGMGGTSGCVDDVLCMQGFHWDSAVCKCVPTVPGCSVDADCHGPLPQICQVCSNGSNGCAHHECIAGKCTIVTCSDAVAL